MSLYQLAKDIDVDFQFNTKVEKILTENKQVTGIKTESEWIKADIVISNSPVAATKPLYQGLSISCAKSAYLYDQVLIFLFSP